ncbi:feruloyl-CoA synthase [Steroidobacter agaridevorans]|uniref:feruloyl-CoA synthase n=1 Tax=Steroidobacter agaridevorans TaxID=2695856 RepID=UPI00192A3CFE|nr:feruloyl-CoA synthase [Steroidobacter agaridevorans]
MAEQRADGCWSLRSLDPLRSYPRRFTEYLARWAKERPDAVWLAQRDAHDEWRKLSYSAAFAQIQRIAAGLLQRNLSAERPLVILSGNSIEHALLTFAAMHIGVPVAPLSPAYSLVDPEARRVLHAVSLLTPGLVYAEDARAFDTAVSLAVPAETEVVALDGHISSRPHSPFASLIGEASVDVERAHEAVTGDTMAKFMFTSGSTRMPKAVINTHRMLSCNQQMYAQCYPFLEDEPPVLVDWLPWHHTAGGNANMGTVLAHGGTLYIDAGKPTAAGMAQTVANLREVAPTIYYTVPKGLEMLVDAMRADERLRAHFFSRMKLIFPAGAGLPKPVQDAIDEMSMQVRGRKTPMTMGLGMTETAPFAISAHLPTWQPGVIGLPAPGVEVKLAPVADKLEVRYRGPSITPGYWRQPEISREAFDEEGFFCSGDAAVFIDPAQPSLGLRFDGRIAEDFKLSSGTWVNVGAMRAAVLAAGTPYIHDVVFVGQDRDELGMLVFLSAGGSRLSSAGVQTWLGDLLKVLAHRAGGGSQRVTRALVLEQPPSIVAGEITDKGTINQRAVILARQAMVERLYSSDRERDVVVLS